MYFHIYESWVIFGWVRESPAELKKRIKALHSTNDPDSHIVFKLILMFPDSVNVESAGTV